MESGAENDQLEAILVVKEGGDVDLVSDDRGLARRVIETASDLTGDQPSAVRYFPKANAAVITATSRFFRQILKDENLAIASATDIDLIDFFFPE